MSREDIRRIVADDEQWYRKIWSLDVEDMSWVESTAAQVDFIWAALKLSGTERVLDLACGFGRHACELARRGCRVVGVDITADYVQRAREVASRMGVEASFMCADLRDLDFDNEFDVVLNLADGAIGYLEDDGENLRIFDVVALALKTGGRHVMDICSGDYAAKHFPRRSWEVGAKALSLADFQWDPQRSLMYYGGLSFKYGEPLERPTEIHSNPTRLYTVRELREILSRRRMTLLHGYADFDLARDATDDTFQIQVVSRKDPT